MSTATAPQQATAAAAAAAQATPPTTSSSPTSSATDAQLQRLLAGQALANEDTAAMCDFTLEQQNAAVEAQGVQSSAPADYVPVLGKTVTYIVATVLINADDEVLMMQEAKESCAGKWYLPAGRMEQGETIVEAAEREVLEETGLRVAITTLLAVECAGGSWYRFVCTGRMISGELKTPTRADAESLQAKWIDNLGDLSLRSNDILPLVELGRAHARRPTPSAAPSSATKTHWHADILPAPKSHRRNFLRVVVAAKRRATNRVHVLLSERIALHLPLVELHPGRSIHTTLRKFLIELFGAELPQHRPTGIMAVEHAPARGGSGSSAASAMDGLCLTVLVAVRPPLEDVPLLGKCVWKELARSVDESLVTMLSGRNAAIELHVVR